MMEIRTQTLAHSLGRDKKKYEMSACEENEEFFVRAQRYHSHHSTPHGTNGANERERCSSEPIKFGVGMFKLFYECRFFFFVRCCWRLVSLEIHTILSHYITVCRSASRYLTAIGTHSHTDPAYGE